MPLGFVQAAFLLRGAELSGLEIEVEVIAATWVELRLAGRTAIFTVQIGPYAKLHSAAST